MAADRVTSSSIERGARVAGADYSADAVTKANGRFASREAWEGAIQIADQRVPVDAEQFDVVICIETIEHLFDEARDRLLREFRRLLKPGGWLLLTTPNEENLDRDTVFCPNCAYAFHRMQHMSSWSKAALTELLISADFKVDFCEGIHFLRWHNTKKRLRPDLSSSISERTSVQQTGAALSAAGTASRRRCPKMKLACRRQAGTSGRAALADARAWSDGRERPALKKN
jgi:SAM-dependent methyltransferase